MSYSNNPDYNASILSGYIDAAYIARYNGQSSFVGATPYQYAWAIHQYCADGIYQCGTTPETYGGAAIPAPGQIDEDYETTIVAFYGNVGRTLIDTVTPTAPETGQVGVSTQPNLQWQTGLASVKSYLAEIASDPYDLNYADNATSCSTCTFWQTTTNYYLTVPASGNLAAGTTYFWQILPQGTYKYGNWSMTSNFTTSCPSGVQVKYAPTPSYLTLSFGGAALPAATAVGCSTPTPPPVCQPLTSPPYTAPEGYTWVWNVATCSWVLTSASTSPPPSSCPNPTTEIPPGPYWVWNTTDCEWEQTGGGAGSPIIIDTDGSGFHLTSEANGVAFDFFGTGNPIQISWTARGSTNGWLALDRNHNGSIDSARELFGDITAQPLSPGVSPNGFIALGVYDSPSLGGNGDGKIDRADKIWPDLLVWIDANHDGISQPEELHHLDDIGIHSILLTYTDSSRVDQFGNKFRYKGRLNAIDVDDVNRNIFDVFVLLPQPN